MTPNQIIAALPALTAHDLRAIRAAADALLGPVATPAPILFDAMVRLLGLRLPYSRFQANSRFKAWQHGEALVTNFVHDTWPEIENSKVAQTAMQSFLLDILISDLKKRNLPVSPGVIAVNLERIPQCFEAAFPGYRDGGWAKLILNSMLRRKTNGK